MVRVKVKILLMFETILFPKDLKMMGQPFMYNYRNFNLICNLTKIL